VSIDRGINDMKLLWKRAIRRTIFGLAVVSLQVRAEVAASKSSLSASVNDGLVQVLELFALKWGWLIGIVLIALVVVARNRKAP